MPALLFWNVISGAFSMSEITGKICPLLFTQRFFCCAVLLEFWGKKEIKILSFLCLFGTLGFKIYRKVISGTSMFN